MTATELTPMLTVKDAASAVDFYGRAFGAREVARVAAPTGQLVIELSLAGDVAAGIALAPPDSRLRGSRHADGGRRRRACGPPPATIPVRGEGVPQSYDRASRSVPGRGMPPHRPGWVWVRRIHVTRSVPGC